MENKYYARLALPTEGTGWAIVNAETHEVEESGFSSFNAAQSYIWKEYDAN